MRMALCQSLSILFTATGTSHLICLGVFMHSDNLDINWLAADARTSHESRVRQQPVQSPSLQMALKSAGLGGDQHTREPYICTERTADCSSFAIHFQPFMADHKVILVFYISTMRAVNLEELKWVRTVTL